MTLSIIIVNYNVKYFLEQCLYSVRNAIKNIETEVFVVDNNSVDGSCQMVKEKFPEVKLIANKDNRGFSKANNQALELSTGKYALLLNPDTVVQEDTFDKIVAFMDKTPQAGGLGVKMIDGNGHYLPESKRALPTPMVSFFKIFGFTRLFPHSKRFARYYLGHLDKNQVNEIEILSGAFMFMRKEALNKTGFLDESFFMYGEDIDLSYRILKAGYKNYYFSETTIIHYKGESTKKGSLNYVFTFYNAMIIFAQKHFSKKNARLFSFFIKFAIYFRAFLSVIKRIFDKLYLPVIDFSLIFFTYYLGVPLWEKVRFPDGGTYPDIYTQIIIPIYIAIWLLGIYFGGGYRKTIKIKNSAKGILFSTACILIIYALLSGQYHFSRALIIFGSLAILIYTFLVRYLFHFFKIGGIKIHSYKKKKLLVIGNYNETERIKTILNQTIGNFEYVGTVCTDYQSNETILGTFNQLEDIIQVYQIDEIIFCTKDLGTQRIIETMLKLSSLQVEFKIAPPESISIIGSNSIDTSGDIYSIAVNSIGLKKNRQKKRLFDLFFALFFLFLSPVFIFLQKKKQHYFKNLIQVLYGKKTIVGYTTDNKNLPDLKPSLLKTELLYKNKKLTKNFAGKIDFIYAKNYQIQTDFLLLIKGIQMIGY